MQLYYLFSLRITFNSCRLVGKTQRKRKILAENAHSGVHQSLNACRSEIRHPGAPWISHEPRRHAHRQEIGHLCAPYQLPMTCMHVGKKSINLDPIHFDFRRLLWENPFCAMDFPFRMHIGQKSGISMH